MTELTKLAPTKEAINAHRATDTSHYGVAIRTKRGSWRCVVATARNAYGDDLGYWTIAGEGSSNGSRRTFIRYDEVVEARGYIV